MTQVLVKADASQQYKQDIKGASHTFISDAPKEFGGGDLGPNPHELLLGALGSCTAITMQMYAKKKGWDLKSVEVDVQEEQVDDAENPGKKLSKITREIKVSGELDAEQIESLKGAADRCPIHKILQGPKQITTNVTK